MNYIIRRLLQAIIVLFGVSIISFGFQFLSGDPTYAIIGEAQGMTQEQVDAFRHSMGFDRPIPIQYIDWLSKALKGDLGKSIYYSKPNTEMISQRFPATVEIAVFAMTLSLIIAIPLGIIAATNRNTFWDRASMIIALIGQSLPTFWVGLMSILVFAVWLKWLPVSGRGTFRHLILPSVTLSLYPLARNTRMIRSTLLEVLGEDYIRTARAKGLKPPQVLVKHALRNALIPVITLIAIDFGSLLGGAMVVETIFAWPGMGTLTVNSIFAKDLPLVQACVVFLAVIFVFINLMVDFVYVLLDPRVRIG